MLHPLNWLGKYRDLVLAIGLFLLLDLGVLVFNFHTSRAIEADTRLINTAGEIRMATQQLTKALLTLAQETRAQESTQTSLAQLGQARDTFNGSLKLLYTALPETATDPATIESRRLLEELKHHWLPLDRDIGPLLVGGPPDLDSVERTTTKATSRNLKLMGQSDDLGRQLESVAVAKAGVLRSIQLLAILLATLNFVFIVFKFVNRLQRSDRLADAAREDTALILASVREGLFLIGRDRRIASQRSASLAALLGRPLADGGDGGEGYDFGALLRELVSEKDAAATEELVDILFSRRINGELIEQLNPLHEVEILATDADQRRIPRFLNFQFAQTPGADGALLVTVFDVTQKVLLARELAGSRQKAKGEVELLLSVLDLDPAAVGSFIDDARAGLTAINDTLKSTPASAAAYRRLIEGIGRRVHGLKGEAAALDLGAIEQQAHSFEDLLHSLRRRDDLVGEDLIPVAVEIAALGDQLQRVEQIVGRVGAFAAARPAANTDCLPTVLAHARRLGERCAGELDKRLRIEVSAPAVVGASQPVVAMLREALPQLVRNAVVHGIEAAAERELGNKPEIGTLRIELDVDADGTLRVSVRDDGRGLSPARLREAIVARGRVSHEAAQAMSDQQVVATIFEPGFSTLPAATMHAGRGDGLALVRERIVALGGRLRIVSQADKFTEFLFHVKAPA